MQRLKQGSAWLAVLLFIAALVAYVSEAGFVQAAETATAQVSFVPMEDMQAPVMEFTTASGQTINVLAQSDNLFYDYREGMQVAVLYDPALPERVKFDHFFVLWAATSFFLFAGLFVLGYYLLSRRFITLLKERRDADVFR